MITNLVVLKDLIDREIVHFDSGILLTPVDQHTSGWESRKHYSEDVPSDYESKSDSQSDSHYDSDDSESEFEVENLNDLVENGERIVEVLDRIGEEPTDKHQLTSEEDNCCVKNENTQEAD